MVETERRFLNDLGPLDFRLIVIDDRTSFFMKFPLKEAH
jgi:hypothetical protein